MTGLFITGTDTGTGKTVVSAAILSILRACGVDAVPMKPSQSGCISRKGALVATDLEFCLRAAGLDPVEDEKRAMCPYRFKPACSPHLAAELAGRRISIETIDRKYRKLARVHDFVVVEGAGGVLVPISQDRTMLDVMKALAIPIVLVARPGLGTINHTLLSLGELKRAGLNVLGIVFNQTYPGRPGYIEKSNAETIMKLGGVPVIGHIPYVPDLARLHRSPPVFARWAATHLKLANVLSDI